MFESTSKHTKRASNKTPSLCKNKVHKVVIVSLNTQLKISNDGMDYLKSSADKRMKIVKSKVRGREAKEYREKLKTSLSKSQRRSEEKFSAKKCMTSRPK